MPDVAFTVDGEKAVWRGMVGDAAAMPTLAFVKKFRKEFEDYIDGRRAGTPVMSAQELAGAAH